VATEIDLGPTVVAHSSPTVIGAVELSGEDRIHFEAANIGAGTLEFFRVEIKAAAAGTWYIYNDGWTAQNVTLVWFAGNLSILPPDGRGAAILDSNGAVAVRFVASTIDEETTVVVRGKAQ
jgi:hypothetical protein